MSIFMNKNRRSRGTIKAILSFALFVTVSVLMSTSALAAGNDSLPDKAGFKDNTTIKKQGYTISVPTYYESDINEDDEYRAYAKDDEFAMLIIDVYDDMSAVSFKDDSQRQLFVESAVYEMDSAGKIIESSYKKFGNLEGAYSVFNFSMEGLDFKGTMFAAIDGDYCYCFMLAETMGNKYDYQPDFLKVIKSATK